MRGLCADCPVRLDCLEAALADPDLMGLWGGTMDARPAGDPAGENGGVGGR